VGLTALLRDEFQIVQTVVRALPYFTVTVQVMLITRRCLALSCTILCLSWGAPSLLVRMASTLRT
jgi:hypothetical protein